MESTTPTHTIRRLCLFGMAAAAVLGLMCHKAALRFSPLDVTFEPSDITIGLTS